MPQALPGIGLVAPGDEFTTELEINNPNFELVDNKRSVTQPSQTATTPPVDNTPKEVS